MAFVKHLMSTKAFQNCYTDSNAFVMGIYTGMMTGYILSAYRGKTREVWDYLATMQDAKVFLVCFEHALDKRVS